MNMIELKNPPLDIAGYVTAKKFGASEKNESNLRELIKQGTSNIAAIGCPFGTITNLKKEINDGGYKVQFVQIAGMTAFADLYLKKF
jgi:hypothetical protein